MSAIESPYGINQFEEGFWPEIARDHLETSGFYTTVDLILKDHPYMRAEEVAWDQDRQPSTEGVQGKDANSAGIALCWDEYSEPIYDQYGTATGIRRRFKTVTIEANVEGEITVRGGMSHSNVRHNFNDDLSREAVLKHALDNPREIDLIRPLIPARTPLM